MFDSNLLFKNAAVTTDGFGTELTLKKTPAAGVWVEIACTAVTGTGTPTVNTVLYGKATASVASSDTVLATFPAITATGRVCRLVQTDLLYVRPYFTVTGTTPSLTLTMGIVSGPVQDAVV